MLPACFKAAADNMEKADERSATDIEATPDILSQTATPKSTPRTTLAHVVSWVRTSDKLPTTPPPSGGVRAWSTAFLASLVLLNTWGFINSFGVFQTYYVNTMKLGSNTAVSWIGSLQIFLVYAVGVLSGRAQDAGFFRLVYVMGSVVYLVGMFMLSMCQSYWQVFLAQAVCVGVGFGGVFVPCLALVSTYFSHEKRGMAIAIAVAGSSSGGLVFPAIAEQMLPYGFGWTVRTMAFVQMVIAVAGGIYLKPRLPPRKTGPIIEWNAFREAPYILFVISSYFFFWGVYVGFYYVGSYGREVLGTSQSTSINLLLTMNGVGLIARTVPNYVAEKWTGPLNLLIPYIVLTGILLYSWMAVSSETGLWVFAVMYGIASSGLTGLYPVVLARLTDDPRKQGVRSGMGFAIVGCAVLTGPPIAGALVQKLDGAYLGLQLFSASTMVVAFDVAVAARFAKVGRAFRARI